MRFTRARNLGGILCSVALLTFVSPLRAETLTWIGAAGSTFTSWSWATNTNWANESGAASTPGGHDLVITTNSSVTSWPSNPQDGANMWVGANMNVNSVTFTNLTGFMPSPLRITGTNLSSNTAARGLNLTTNGTSGSNVLTAINGANVIFSGAFTNSTGTSTGNLHLGLAYTGMANIHVDGTSTITFTERARIVNVTGFTGGIVKTGAGMVEFTSTANSSTFNGTLTLKEGTWSIADTNQLGNATSGVGNVTFDGGRLRVTETTGATSGRNFFVGADGGSIEVTAGKTLTIAGAINNSIGETSSGMLSKVGAGTLLLNNSNGAFAGGFNLIEGTLQIGANNTTANGPVGSGALRLSGGTLTAATTTSRNLSNAVHLNGAVTIGTEGTGNMIFNNLTSSQAQLLANSTITTVVNVTWQQPISGNFSLTKDGAGGINFGSSAVASTYTGGFELKEGTVTMSSSGNATHNSFGTGTLRLTGGTIISSNISAGGDRNIFNNVILNGHITLGETGSNGGIFFSGTGGGTTTVVSDSTIHTPGATAAINQVMSGTANLTKTGSGQLTISESNPNFTGNLYILGGTVSVDAPGNLGANSLSRTTVIDNATLRFTGTTASGNNRTYSLGADGGTFEVTSTGVSINGAILDYNGEAGRLIKTGSGTLTLNAVNSYSGGTTVSAGTLVASAATLPGNVLNNASLTFNQATNGTYAGIITGTGSLTKTGAGVLALTATHNFSGGTTVSAGGLRIEGTLSGPLEVASGATLSGSGTITGATTIAGFHHPGSSPGIQTFSSDLTYLEGASVGWELNANTSTQGSPTALFDQVIVGGTLDFAGATALNLSFNGAGSTVNWNDAFWSSSQSWRIYETAGVSNFGNLSLVATNWADAEGNLFNTLLTGSTFSLSHVGNDIYLNYAAVPEPSTYAALLGLAGFALVIARRRRRDR
jgi:autotransporter-associated beta strand protein